METEMISLEVNGVAVSVPKGSNLLVAAKAANVKIPTLCYHPDLKPGASCGICVVRQLVPSRTEPGKFVPSPKLLRACCTEAMPGMKIITHDPDIVQVRRTVLELILANPVCVILGKRVYKALWDYMIQRNAGMDPTFNPVKVLGTDEGMECWTKATAG